MGRGVLIDLTFCLAGSFSAHSAEEGQAGLGVLHFIPFLAPFRDSQTILKIEFHGKS